MKNEKGCPCPCCGFLTLSEDSHDTFEICPVCKWEDDDVQFAKPFLKGGANQESLLEAQQNFKNFGASSKEYVKEVMKYFSTESLPK